MNGKKKCHRTWKRWKSGIFYGIYFLWELDIIKHLLLAKPQSQRKETAFTLLAIRNCIYLDKIGSEKRNQSELWLFTVVETSSDGGFLWILLQLPLPPILSHLYFFWILSKPYMYPLMPDEVLNIIFVQVNGIVGTFVVLDWCGFLAGYDTILKSISWNFD